MPCREAEGEAERKQENSENKHRQSPPAARLLFSGDFSWRSLLLYGLLDPYYHRLPPPEAAPPQPPKKRSYLSSALSLELTIEHARLRENMAENSRNHPTPSKLRLRNTAGGEIVEVQGGHIIRSTGRKDRHSKVCTAKGPRDRRVRLAAHTAIQFYDVQDRLGYDRPSKAVDWLIKKAKAAIDELAQLPAWHPTTTCSAQNANFEQDEQNQGQQHLGINADLMITNDNSNNPTIQSSSFLPPSMDSDAIADTIKSFPMGASPESNSSAMEFQSFPCSDLLSRNCNNTNNQDLNLSLQSFQDPFLHHHHNQQPYQNPAAPLGLDGWTEHHHHHHQAAELSHFQRLPAWDAGGAPAAGYLFNFPAAPPPPALHQLLGQNQFLSQRGPLQSSNTPTVRAWMDPSSAVHIDQSQHHHYQQHPSALPIYQSSTGVDGFSGFHTSARIQGDEEEHSGYTNNPSSASSDSRH